MKSEVDRLRGELRQSSDKERDIRPKGRKAVKSLEEKLTMEYTAHGLTTDANSKLREEVSKLEGVNQKLRDVLEERKAWYDEKLKHESA